MALGITPDGVFGSNTDTAVRNFQSANGLTVNGLAGTNTLKKLWDAAEDTVSSNGF